MASTEEKQEQLNSEHAVQLQMLGIDQSMFEQIKEKLVNLPPDEQDIFIRQLSQDYEGIEKILGEQMAIAEMNLGRLSSSQLAQGVQAGDVFVASNPWTSVVEGLDSGINKYMQAKAMQEQRALSGDRSEGLRKAFEMGLDDGDEAEAQVIAPPVSPSAAPPVSSTAAPASSAGQGALSSSLRQPTQMDMMPSHDMNISASHPVPEQPQPPMQPSHPIPQQPQPPMMPSHTPNFVGNQGMTDEERMMLIELQGRG